MAKKPNRQDQMAALVVEIARLQRRKKSDAKELQLEIDQRQGDLTELAEDVRSGQTRFEDVDGVNNG